MSGVIEVGQAVSYLTGRDTRSVVRMVGRVVGSSRTGSALVQVNGNTYEVEPGKLKSIYTCISCGRELRGRANVIREQSYCSVECRYDDLHKDYDDWVFQFIVNFKTEHDGWSPATPTIAERTGLAQLTVRRTLRRLVKAGKLRVVGNGRYQAFIVAGGRWVYEP